MDILSFTVIHLAQSRQVSEFEKNSLFLPNLEMNGSKFVLSKWLVQLFLYGKEESKTTKKGLEHYFSFAYMTSDLMFSFFIKSIIVIKVSPALSTTKVELISPSVPPTQLFLLFLLLPCHMVINGFVSPYSTGLQGEI